jgi:hypothetical protein
MIDQYIYDDDDDYWVLLPFSFSMNEVYQKPFLVAKIATSDTKIDNKTCAIQFAHSTDFISKVLYCFMQCSPTNA